jgi:arabinofuranan 3-O-arabinosyltransferase
VTIGGRPEEVAAAPAGRAVSAVTTGAEHRTITVAAGPAALLSLPEGANAGWRASAGGQSLRQVTVDGWRQGWVLPAGGRAIVRLTFVPGVWHRLGLAAGLLALVVLLLLTGREVRAGRDGDPSRGAPLSAARPRRFERLGLVLLLGFALGGLPGLVVAVGAVAVTFGQADVAAAAGAGALITAGLFAARSDSVSGGRTAGVLALFALLIVAWTGLLGDPARRHRPAEALQHRPFEEHPRQPAG